MLLIAALAMLSSVITGMLSFVALLAPLPFLGFKTRERAALIWAVSMVTLWMGWILWGYAVVESTFSGF